MRTIKFRGIRTDGKGWVYGSYHAAEGRAVIIHKQGINLSQNTEVIPSTVGQFTGLHDKNGVEIYEGDKIKAYYNEYLYNNENLHEFECIVKYDEKEVRFNLYQWWKNRSKYEPLSNIISKYTLEVISNIHEKEEKL